MSKSLQHTLSRVRPPRVHITYDVEIGDAIVMKELPFCVGVLSDLSGHSERPSVRARKCVDIDRDNLDDVMASIQPRLDLKVPHMLGGKSKHFTCTLDFFSMHDFEPIYLVQKVPELASIYEKRVHLKDMMTKIDSNSALRAIMEMLLHDSSKRKELMGAIEKKRPKKTKEHEEKKESSSKESSNDKENA